jgi:hypothetical protein
LRVQVRRWVPLAAVCAVAIGRALLGAAPQPLPPIGDQAAEQAAFLALASQEATVRAEAAKAFPTDLWSRDDDFHERELRRARDWAGAHRVRLGDVLRAVDEGMRATWPHKNPTPLVATVPPCRPRAIY